MIMFIGKIKHSSLDQKKKKRSWLCEATLKTLNCWVSLANWASDCPTFSLHLKRQWGENRQTPQKHLTWMSVHGFSYDQRTCCAFILFSIPPSYICSKKSASASAGKDHTPSGIHREEPFLVYSNIQWLVRSPWHSLACS